MGKPKSMKQRNQSMEARSKNAQKTKADLKSPTEIGPLPPNRPSV